MPNIPEFCPFSDTILKYRIGKTCIVRKGHGNVSISSIDK